MKKAKFISIVLVFCILIGGASLWLFIKSDDEISDWERRKLQQFPEITLERVMDGKFMKEFVSYMTDQFPMRNDLRRRCFSTSISKRITAASIFRTAQQAKSTPK